MMKSPPSLEAEDIEISLKETGRIVKKAVISLWSNKGDSCLFPIT